MLQNRTSRPSKVPLDMNHIFLERSGKDWFTLSGMSINSYFSLLNG